LTETLIAEDWPFVRFRDGLLITPYHPIRIGKEWHFPIDLSQPKLYPCNKYYNLVLTTSHVVVINNMECVTLGHNFTEPVVSHPYFGSKDIIEDLRKLPGWDAGVVQLRKGCFHRDPKTDMIAGFKSGEL